MKQVINITLNVNHNYFNTKIIDSKNKELSNVSSQNLWTEHIIKNN